MNPRLPWDEYLFRPLLHRYTRVLVVLAAVVLVYRWLAGSGPSSGLANGVTCPAQRHHIQASTTPVGTAVAQTSHDAGPAPGRSGRRNAAPSISSIAAAAADKATAQVNGSKTNAMPSKCMYL